MKPVQSKMARAAVGWSIKDLADAAGVHANTIANFEVGRYRGDPETLAAIRQALEGAGVQFIEENGGGAGVRLAKPHGS